MAQAERKPSKLKHNIIRFTNFIKVFLRNKRAAFGLTIILFFTFIAIAAPLLTPFNSLGDDPHFQGYIAAKFAKPAWVRSLPTWLGGDPYVSENLEVVKDAGAPSIGKELCSLELNPELTEIYFTEDVGYPFRVYGVRIEPKAGSLAVKYRREIRTSASGSTVYIYSNFTYPYLGNPGIIIGNVEFLINGSKRVELRPEEQLFIILLNNGEKNPKNGSLSLIVDNIEGLYVEDFHIAATINITDYFGLEFNADKSKAKTYWKNMGYENWWQWINGTSQLPFHWSEMCWVVSDGSLTVKNYTDISNSPFKSMYEEGEDQKYYCFMDDLEICDPDLNSNSNGPDIVSVKPWIKVETKLTKPVSAGEKKIYLESVENFKKGDLVIIGGKGFEETATIDKIDASESSIDLMAPLLSEHKEGEPVANKKQKITLYDNLMLPGNSRKWILLKVVLKDVKSTYNVKVESSFTASVYLSSKLEDTQIKYFPYPFDPWWYTWEIIPWNVFRRLEYLDVPVKVRVFLGEAGQPFEAMTTVFPIKGRPSIGFVETKDGEIIIDRAFSGDAANGFWIISRTSKSTSTSLIQFSDPKEVASLLPSKPGNYIWGVEITFLDRSSAENVETIVYIDDFHLRIVGTAFGILGTDQYGRDLFSQLIYGTRISLYIGILVSVFSVAIGLIVGLFAGYYGGVIDEFLMRTNDLLLVIPGLPLLIVLVAILGAKIENLIILLGLLGWNGFARVVRSMVLSIKERPFIESAKAAGAGTSHIIFKHILPCVMAIVYVSLATSVPGAITAEAALSWLGFYDPMRMSWGRMLHEVFVSGGTTCWWWIIPPGICIALVATAFILLGYALDEILNPKLRMRR
ncbi:MAG: ABC transporter permease [Candidatus Bathyarchaeia archaeon]